MNKIKRGVILLCVFVVSVLFCTICFSQDLTGPEKEAFQFVEGNWENLAKKDLNGFLNNFHQDYIGYVNWKVSPIGKEELAKAVTNWLQKTRAISYKIEPFSVKFYDNIAVVLYRCDLTETNDKDETISAQYLYTDILQKSGEKWLIVAAHKEKR